MQARNWVAGTRPAGGILTIIIVLITAAPAFGDAVQVRRFLTLLTGVEHEYREAFDPDGTLAHPLELEEANLLLGEARAAAARLGLDEGIALQAHVTALAEDVAARAAVEKVTASARQLRNSIQDATGLSEETLPPAPPSAARGEILYAANCVSCHGLQGKGDGADAKNLERRPANFTDESFMRHETPEDFFVVISVGRRRSAMPAWQDSLSVQARWDLVSYVWSFHAPAQRIAGEALFVTNCERCHTIAAVDPNAAPAWDFVQLSTRSDSDLYATITAGKGNMPSFGSLVADERWYLVAAVRQLTLGSGIADPVSAAGGAAHMEAALERVARDVQVAVDAYRLRDPDAGSLGHIAYLEFEPLEPAIAAYDAAAMRRVEDEFSRLQRALAQGDASREVEAAANAVNRALVATKPSSQVTITFSPRGRIIALAALFVSVSSVAVLLYKIRKRWLRNR